jgi:hypothetical protein
MQLLIYLHHYIHCQQYFAHLGMFVEHDSYKTKKEILNTTGIIFLSTCKLSSMLKSIFYLTYFNSFKYYMFNILV